MQQEAERAKAANNEVALKVAIRAALRKIPLDMPRSAIDSFCKRCALCCLAEGAQFKHMMKRKDLPPPPAREVQVVGPAGDPYDLEAFEIYESLHARDIEAEFAGGDGELTEEESDEPGASEE